MRINNLIRNLFPVLFVLVIGCQNSPPDIFLGMGLKTGEIAETSAIVHVRLTEIPAQNEEKLVPGKEGQARLIVSSSKDLKNATITGWLNAQAEDDYSMQFKLEDLVAGTRYYLGVEMRVDENSGIHSTQDFSFKTAPPADKKATVKFQITTGQDVLGIDTYYKMAAQKPDFLISTGDNVYYDKECDGRTVDLAYQCYQIMYGSKPIVDYFRHIGGYFEKDDHDYRFNDADTLMRGKWVRQSLISPGLSRITKEKEDRFFDEAWLSHEDGIRVFKKVFPMSEKTYRTFRWGKGIQIWLVEGRDFRSPNNMPDGPEKSIWGKEQKAWLKSSLLKSDAEYKVIISPTPIIGPDRQSKTDNHANRNGFWTEGRQFLNWIKEKKMDNVILACGDRHWQYHSVHSGFTHEFSCGPTCDEHSVKDKPGQHPPSPSEFEKIEQPYVNLCGGFLTVLYQPDQGIFLNFYDIDGKELYSYKYTN